MMNLNEKICYLLQPIIELNQSCGENVSLLQIIQADTENFCDRHFHTSLCKIFTQVFDNEKYYKNMCELYRVFGQNDAINEWVDSMKVNRTAA
jgi:hypothetical protein